MDPKSTMAPAQSAPKPPSDPRWLPQRCFRLQLPQLPAVLLLPGWLAVQDVTLWWTNILQWKITIFNGKIHYKWPFSIAMLVHQMLNLTIALNDSDIWMWRVLIPSFIWMWYHSGIKWYLYWNVNDSWWFMRPSIVSGYSTACAEAKACAKTASASKSSCLL